jgi:hypothetical protein
MLSKMDIQRDSESEAARKANMIEEVNRIIREYFDENIVFQKPEGCTHIDIDSCRVIEKYD